MFLPFPENDVGEVHKDDLTDFQRAMIASLYLAQPFEAYRLAHTPELEEMAVTFAAWTGRPILLENFSRLLIALRKEGFLPRNPRTQRVNPWPVRKSQLTADEIKLIDELYKSQPILTDKLAYTPQLLRMTLVFAAKTGRTITQGNFLWLILTLRKEGLLSKKRRF